MKILARGILAMLLYSTTIHAASLEWSKIGEGKGHYFGSAACGGADFNNDGYSDVIVSAVGYGSSKAPSQGKLYVWSGKDSGNTLLFSAVGEAKYNYLGSGGGSAGDVNNDGINDIVVGAYGWGSSASSPGYGKVYVYAGGTGQLLFSQDGKSLGLPRGVSFANRGIAKSPGDFNGDGYADIAVSAHRFNADQGKVFLWSGKDGSLLLTLVGSAAGHFGQTLSLSDLNSDGFSDLIVAEPYNAQGLVHIFLGPAGTPASYSPLIGAAQGDRFGISTAAVGDVNGNGFPDLVVGAITEDSNGFTDNGSIRVFDGAAGNHVSTLYGPATNATYGYELNGAGDFNNDGLADIVFAENYGSEYRVCAGYDLSVTLFSYNAPNSAGYVCPVNKASLDVHTKFIGTSPYLDNNFTDDGKIFVFTNAP